MPAPLTTYLTRKNNEMLTEVELMVAGFTKAQRREFATFSPAVQEAWKSMPLKARMKWADDTEQIFGGGVPASYKKPKPEKLAPEAPLTAMAECLMAWKSLDAADGWDTEKLNDAYDRAKSLVKDWNTLRPGVIALEAAAAVLPLRGSRIEAWVKQVFDIIDPHLTPDRRGAAQLVWGYDSRTEGPHPHTPQPPVTLTSFDDMPAPESNGNGVNMSVFLEYLHREPAYATVTAADVPHLPRLVFMQVMATIPETAEGAIETLRKLAIKEPDMAPAIAEILDNL